MPEPVKRSQRSGHYVPSLGISGLSLKHSPILLQNRSCVVQEACITPVTIPKNRISFIVPKFCRYRTTSFYIPTFNLLCLLLKMCSSSCLPLQSLLRLLNTMKFLDGAFKDGSVSLPRDV